MRCFAAARRNLTGIGVVANTAVKKLRAQRRKFAGAAFEQASTAAQGRACQGNTL